MTGADVLQAFQTRVDSFVASSLSGYAPETHAKDKSIRDAIWGTSHFHPWEVAILDSPLLQRLRDIRQTGLAYLVYPTALHTRFDHTLGVTTVASRIVRSINDKYPMRKDSRISYADHMCVRLSALLHDVGHSCLSHVSETMYGASEEFETLLRQVNDVFGVKPKPHEILSWLVVRSVPFRRFVEQLKAKGILVDWDCTEEDMEDIAGNIIGYRKDPTEKFLADIVNGPMDADKLDYLMRDAYFAGPSVVYDLDRFLHTVNAIEYPRDPSLLEQGPKIVRLSVPMEGVTALEQIIISKLMLFSYLYHHHKIRCVEAMCHEALRRWMELSGQNSRPKGPPLDHPVSFLNVSDRSLLPSVWPPEMVGDKVAGELVKMLTTRDLYKRALVISRLFIEKVDTHEKVNSGFERVLRCGTSRADRDMLRERIFAQARKLMGTNSYGKGARDLRKRFKIHHVLLDIPQCPTVEETVAVMIPLSSDVRGSNAEYVPQSEVFPIEKWVDAYNAIKWRGYVFALQEAVPFVNQAALAVLAKDPYDLEFRNQATDLCKIRDPFSAGPGRFPGW
jgi:HD superfamily phosphohydrolase